MKNQVIYGLLLVGLLIFGFQNCSPTQFSSNSNDNSSVQVTGTNEVIRSLQPTLAVRAMGCIQCHAQVASNIVTDFGYGDAYYFGQKDGASYWNNTSPYGDHGNDFNTMIISAGSTVYVPQASAPAIVTSSTGATSLAQYILQQFASSTTASTQSTAVTELSSVYIGAPLDIDLISAFNLLPNQRSQFHPSAQAQGGLSGLVDKGTFFKNSGTLTCDGDLVIRGPLYLENLNLNSVAGCRIYVIGSVFIYGPIQYLNSSALTNLQITSTKIIALGLGTEKDSTGQHCEPSSRYALNTSDPSYAKSSSLSTRVTDLYTVPFSYVRAATDPVAFGNTILQDATTIQDSIGTLYDASCRSETRNVSYSKILLNAPLVHSRYTGAVQGTVIGEYVMMSLSQFNFTFDPVFNSVDVLPYLDQAIYLKHVK